MAKASDQVRASDITVWGAAALAVWAVAVVSANIGALIPPNVFAGLHATRLEGATINQLKAQVATLETETSAMRQEAKALNQRFLLREEMNNDMTQRVGSLELTIPKLLEAMPPETLVDQSAVTASIGAAPTLTPVEGGSMSVSSTPLTAPRPLGPLVQPIPEALSAGSFGIALGPPVDRTQVGSVWASLTTRAGTLLNGLTPLVGNLEGLATKRLVAGPLTREGEASALCGRFAQAGIACSVVPYSGVPLPEMD
ncbi:MAG: hypothetical protein ABL879_13195 [Devosia sp.]